MAIVTVSKWTFSGAGELARFTADRLGYRLVSRREIIEKTAQYGMSRESLDRALRRRTGMLHRMDREWRHYLVYARAALTKEI